MGNFIKEFKGKQLQVHETAVSLGWWDDERNSGELIALMHSELSEALEALRNEKEMIKAGIYERG